MADELRELDVPEEDAAEEAGTDVLTPEGGLNYSVEHLLVTLKILATELAAVQKAPDADPVAVEEAHAGAELCQALLLVMAGDLIVNQDVNEDQPFRSVLKYLKVVNGPTVPGHLDVAFDILHEGDEGVEVRPDLNLDPRILETLEQWGNDPTIFTKLYSVGPERCMLFGDDQPKVAYRLQMSFAAMEKAQRTPREVVGNNPSLPVDGLFDENDITIPGKLAQLISGVRESMSLGPVLHDTMPSKLARLVSGVRETMSLGLVPHDASVAKTDAPPEILPDTPSLSDISTKPPPETVRALSPKELLGQLAQLLIRSEPPKESGQVGHLPVPPLRIRVLELLFQSGPPTSPPPTENPVGASAKERALFYLAARRIRPKADATLHGGLSRAGTQFTRTLSPGVLGDSSEGKIPEKGK